MTTQQAQEGSPYPYVQAWGKLLGHHTGYVEQQITRARQLELPPTVLYERHADGVGRTGVWATIDTIPDGDTRGQLHRWAEQYAGRALPVPSAPRCQATVRHLLVSGECGALLDIDGECPRRGRHAEVKA